MGKPRIRREYITYPIKTRTEETSGREREE